MPSPTEANASTEKNMAKEEDRRVAGKVDKNVSTEFDANNLIPSYSVFVALLNFLVCVMSKHLSHGLSNGHGSISISTYET